ncbi:methionine biosynthesis protein MetW [Candidatus Raskinella chloraquaticus]|jgi:methionine biosynthesis protein MetW|uniref:Methionine biosynthesis protein MetW n=1 Tax=Candidatus Raskinella chloraquaticus TaxID=1951219 RepID=A0A1W9HRP0_9HYPH|nr:MAG: methionine biosynthesis protein MetW [Proteobacteria bacterium SG_bin8]
MARQIPLIPEARVDLLLIADMIEQGARVLDVGCGDGALLRHLRLQRGVEGRGVDMSWANVNTCVAGGLSVVQGNADHDLGTYPDQAFDVVILSQTLQATANPRDVLTHMLRIGKRAIVSFPNFAHWRIRWQILAWGRMPVTETIGYRWYDTPNIHLCTIRDFVELAGEVGARIERALPLDRLGRPFRETLPVSIANIMAPQALFVLTKTS